MNETTSARDDSRSAGGVKRWFLLTGNRLVVSVLLLLGIGGLLAGAGLLGVATVTKPSRVLWFLNGTINGLLTLVPISVGVNQIVLSHEFGSVEDLYERRRDITKFRKRVERHTNATTNSPHAATFFSILLATVAETARSVRREYDRDRDGETPEEVRTLVRSLTEQAERTNDELDAEETDMLRTLLTMLNYDNSVEFDETRRLREGTSDLDAEVKAKLHRLEELLTEIDAARQYLKTVVVERQLARLSRLLIYTGIFAIAVAVVGIFAYRDVAWLALSSPLLVGVASTLVAVSLLPLAVLSAYILRIATVARRTAVFGPFVPESKLPSDDDWRR